MAREYFSIPEAAAILGISRIAVFKKVKKGQLAALRFGRNWAVPASALAAPAVPVVPALPPPSSTPARAARENAAAPPTSSDEDMDSMGWD